MMHYAAQKLGSEYLIPVNISYISKASKYDTMDGIY